MKDSSLFSTSSTIQFIAIFCDPTHTSHFLCRTLVVVNSKPLQNASLSTPLRCEAEFVMIYDNARKHSFGLAVKGKPNDINYQSIICGNATCHKSYIADIG